MSTTDPWNLLLMSIGQLRALLIDCLGAVGAFGVMGVTALVVHKSVEQFQLWGVPSDLIEGMEVVNACIWTINVFAVWWLCASAAIRFCKRVTRSRL